MGLAIGKLSVVLLALAATSPALAEQCDFMAATGDAQYTATNVRSAPSAKAEVVMTLEATAPVEVHAIGHQGDWYRLDRILDAEQDKTLFAGTAWVHRSQLVLSVAGGDHRLYTRPSKASARIMRLTPDGNMLDVVGCRGRWVEVVVDKKTRGWMSPDAQCSNPMTTCS